MNMDKRLAALEVMRNKEEADTTVLVCRVVDTNHCTGVLVGYRLGHRKGESVHLLPDETEEELQDRAVDRYKQLYPEKLKRHIETSGKGFVVLDEIYDEKKGYCIPC